MQAIGMGRRLNSTQVVLLELPFLHRVNPDHKQQLDDQL